MFQTIGNGTSRFQIFPGGNATRALFNLASASDPANCAKVTGDLNGTTFSFQSLLTGTGLGITAQNFGEQSTAATLATINFQFNGVTQSALSKLGVLSFPTVTGGLSFKSGSNARVGSGTLSGGTLIVANTSVTANSMILVQNTGGGVLANVGALFVASQTASTGFTISSSNVLDTSSFKYLIVETP
jgi:hypothetical protein